VKARSLGAEFSNQTWHRARSIRAADDIPSALAAEEIRQVHHGPWSCGGWGP
jgi:hypothetical protein